MTLQEAYEQVLSDGVIPEDSFAAIIKSASDEEVQSVYKAFSSKVSLAVFEIVQNFPEDGKALVSATSLGGVGIISCIQKN
jgi:hypothetical protein